MLRKMTVPTPPGTPRRPGAVCALLLCLAACGGGGGGVRLGDPPTEPGPVRTADVRLDSDAAGAALSIVPQVCCAGERVHAVWYDLRNGATDIYYRGSADGGLGWGGGDIRLDTDPAGDGYSWLPRVACSGSHVYVVWHDERDGAADVRFNRSLDGGVTWLASDRRLDTDAAGAAASLEPHLACEGDHVVVVWTDGRSGNWDVRANVSTDAGSTWLAEDVRVDHGPVLSAATLPRVALRAGSAHVLWLDTRDAGVDVYTTQSADGGASWGAPDRRLSRGAPLGGWAAAAELVAAGDSVYAAFEDYLDGAADVYLAASLDGGASFGAAVRLDTDAAGAADSLAPALCAQGDELTLVWEEHRAGHPDVHLSRTQDGGASWILRDLHLNSTLPGRSRSLRPQVACCGPALSVAFTDDLDGRFDVFLAHSPDGGQSWLTPEARMDSDGAGRSHALQAALCCASGWVVVVWADQRAGPGDIHANRAVFPSASP